MTEKILNHNFGYGTGENNKDSKINKLKLSNINELKVYIEELIMSQVNGALVCDNIIKTPFFSDIRLIIKSI